jgi:hypothetical protein
MSSSAISFVKFKKAINKIWHFAKITNPLSVFNASNFYRSFISYFAKLLAVFVALCFAYYVFYDIGGYFYRFLGNSVYIKVLSIEEVKDKSIKDIFSALPKAHDEKFKAKLDFDLIKNIGKVKLDKYDAILIMHNDGIKYDEILDAKYIRPIINARQSEICKGYLCEEFYYDSATKNCYIDKNDKQKIILIRPAGKSEDFNIIRDYIKGHCFK